MAGGREGEMDGEKGSERVGGGGEGKSEGG